MELNNYSGADRLSSHGLAKMEDLTLENIRNWHLEVARDNKYGKEEQLIKRILTRYPQNDDILTVAMKIAVIDVTNSTQLSKHKSKLSLFDIANIIMSMNIDGELDKKLASGNETLVSELARNFKGENGSGVNLFSFASKYCCYHNYFVYGKDDYSIYDNVVATHLHEYPLKVNAIDKNQAKKWMSDFDYESFNQHIGKLLDENGITKTSEPYRRREFDHFIWFANRKNQ